MKSISHSAFQIVLVFIERFFEVNSNFRISLRSALIEVEYAKGVRVLNYQQTQHRIWFLLKGLAREVQVDEMTLAEYTSWFWQEGTLVCVEPGFFSQEPSDKAIEILEDSVLVFLDYQDWLRLKHEFPDIEQTVERLRSFYARGRQRFVVELLKRSAEERYQEHKRELEALFLKTKVKYIAEYLGVTPDTLSRLRKQGFK
ncbi:Crp/Fnr family transcriptional regulator [Pedobacter deserti]|uniref:Crp/Fnr family transcriptional regulator n=1 Tax=Pedobacter deserti TaxID=2817382 RepID=UPI00210B8635|nr:hypothetical protein [Pedobacter sp. SYSU D00382]